MTLNNLILPFIFFEIFGVLLGLIFVIGIEIIIISYLVKFEIDDLQTICIKANIVTTLIGYFSQGILRFIFGMTINSERFDDNSYVQGILGTIGFTKNVNLEIATSITVSIIIAFLISSIFELKFYLKKKYNQYERISITKSVVLANLISYIFLYFLIYFLNKK